MAANSDYTKAVYGGEGGDVSHLVGDVGAALVGGSSMSAGNTINSPNTVVGPAPGSTPVNLPASGPDYHADAPAVEIPPVENHAKKVS